MFPSDAMQREKNQFCAELILQHCIAIYTQFFTISFPMSLTQLEFHFQLLLSNSFLLNQTNFFQQLIMK